MDDARVSAAISSWICVDIAVQLHGRLRYSRGLATLLTECFRVIVHSRFAKGGIGDIREFEIEHGHPIMG